MFTHFLQLFWSLNYFFPEQSSYLQILAVLRTDPIIFFKAKRVVNADIEVKNYHLKKQML